MRRMFGGVPMHPRKITCCDHFGEFGEINGGNQRFVALPHIVERVLRVDHEAVDDMRDCLGHVTLPTGLVALAGDTPASLRLRQPKCAPLHQGAPTKRSGLCGAG
jgi:hypothetical protein